MPKIKVEFESMILGIPQIVHVHIPKKRSVKSEGEVRDKVLFLLHGKSGCGNTFYEYTNIVHLSNKYNLITVMPDMHNSFYTNMVYGEKYFDYMTKELPNVLKTIMALDLDSTENYVLGYSMGGYGAMKWGLTEPTLFSGIGSLSGSLRSLQDTLNKITYENRRDLFLAFGNHALERKEDDLYALVKEAKKRKEKLAPIYLYCGRNDGLIDVNRRFHRFLQELSIEHRYIEDDGIHDFKNWNIHIENYLEWITRSKV